MEVRLGMVWRSKFTALVAVLAVGAATALAACAPPSTHEEATPAPAVEGGMTLTIANNNVLDMRVFLVRDGYRYRIGTVSSMTTQVFQISPRMLGGAHELRLLADPIGSRDAFSTEPIPIQTGATIEWQVERDIRFSSVTLR
jgi:hypothetical protein